MTMYILTLAGWIVCSIYSTIPSFWLMVHPFVAYWRAGRGNPYKVLTPAWVAMWMVAAAASYPWRFALLYDKPFVRLLAIPFWCATAYVYFSGHAHLSFNKIIGRHELEPERHSQHLVITGLHRRMRHPIYTGHLCTMLGWCFLTSSIAIFALTAFAIVTGVFLVRTEDAELERRFGREFREYKKRTPAILPRFS